MVRNLVLAALLAWFPVVAGADTAAVAKITKTTKAAKTVKSDATDAKELSGMSVLGNNDTPKALYIVPWRSSELGAEADLRTGLLNDAMAPVDKDVFLRQLQFYEISSGQR
jgi:hypothetical protein